MSDDEAQARLDNYLGHMLEAAQLARHLISGMQPAVAARIVRALEILANSRCASTNGW
jgi:hypothetical protein